MAVLVCDTPEHDFGEVNEFEVLNHVFTLRNTGEHPVNILHVQSTCGCTTAGVTDQQLAPGATTELAARISLLGRSGPQNYSLRVQTDDSAHPVIFLRLHGSVMRDFIVDPQRLAFSWPAAQDALSAGVTLTSGGVTEFAITGIRVSDSAIAADVPMLQKGRTHLVTVRIDPERMQAPFQGSVTVETDHPRRPLVHLPIHVTAGGGVVVRPTTIKLTAQSGKVPQQRLLIVYSRNSTAFTITAITLPDGSRGSVRTVSPHRHDIQLEGLLPDPALLQTPITITTSLGETIEIPFQLID